MKILNKHALASFVLLAAAGLLAPAVAAAGEPQLDQAVQQGKDLFSHATFGGNGKVCESCHLAGGTKPGQLPNGKAIPSLNNAAAIFPRFNPKANKVVTLGEQVRNCVAKALQGNPPEYGSAELNAIVSYLTFLAQGKPVDMGGKPQ
ncbi:MAG: cytochrome C [Sideroxydans sp.]|nr:cytochrome C [Sideroxydans sp.]